MTAIAPARASAQSVVRRLIVFVLLFTLVVIFAIGLSGLLGRLFDASATVGDSDVSGLAQSLAFTLIAGPLAGLLWWFVWRSLRDEQERSATGWGLYTAGMLSVALITFSSYLLGAVSNLLAGQWRTDVVAAGIVWAGVWLWHRWMWRHPERGPRRLVAVGPVIGSTFGLILGVGGLLAALSTLLGAAIARVPDTVSFGQPWWLPILQSLVWAAGGGLIWWSQWFLDRARDRPSAFGSVVLVVVGIGSAALLGLFGIGTIVFVLLRLIADRTEPLDAMLDPLHSAIAAALVGVLVWRYHHNVVLTRTPAVQLAARLVLSGIGLVSAASGIGIIVNSLLAASVLTLIDTSPRTLLLGGLSALLVGAPLWWRVWRPAHRVEEAEARSIGRRVYLISIFGASAIVALIALLVIAFRLFEVTLDNAGGQILIDRVRAPLGLLLATALTAGYHYKIWRSDRAAFPNLAPTVPMIGQVVLVTGADPEAFSRAITAATGARVIVWPRADADRSAPDIESVVAALARVSGETVLLLAGPSERIEVVALASAPVGVPAR